MVVRDPLHKVSCAFSVEEAIVTRASRRLKQLRLDDVGKTEHLVEIE